MKAKRMEAAAVIAVLGLAAGAGAQTQAGRAGGKGITIGEAVEGAVKNYPSVRVTQEQMNAAAAGIRLAQTAYLPRVDGLAQVNRATRNTYYGLLTPQGIIPGVDGSPANNGGTVWDSGVGVLVQWQPFDFGLRAANVAAASAAREQARAAVARTQYEVSVQAAEAFLTLVAAEQTVQAAQAAVQSWEVLLKSTHALAAAELRPGADEARVRAELAMASTQEAEAEQAAGQARAMLAQYAGREASELKAVPGSMLERLPAERTEAALDAAANPLAREQNAAVAVEQSKLHALDRSYFPEFTLDGLASARGTGLELNGARLGGWNGLAPTVQNYSVGMTVTFGAMDRFAIREQEAMEAATVRAARAQEDVIQTKLKAQFAAAQAAFAGARKVAENTPVEVASAKAALDQATARYQAGLAPVDDLAQAERLMVQARIDDALARLNVWRARLEMDAARGDITDFVQEAGR